LAARFRNRVKAKPKDSVLEALARKLARMSRQVLIRAETREPSKPAGRGDPTLGRFDSFAAP
jgi:hypothetical protein